MTSHLIESFAKRTNELGGIGNNSAEEPEIARKISRLNRPDDCAFYILPIRPGHVLVIPKEHISRLSELPEDVAGRLGMTVTRVARAITRALDNTALNVVCNQEYAQAVPHVHYHIVPAPLQDYANPPIKPVDESPEKEPAYQNMLRAELLLRNELDDEDGKKLAEMIQAKL
ncbi:hypothetical protein FRC04_006322 [Tulasnella sp. 424]|nr:hypothetical protein FRC04_006322 [Tulasnella sp. 424]